MTLKSQIQLLIMRAQWQNPIETIQEGQVRSIEETTSIWHVAQYNSQHPPIVKNNTSNWYAIHVNNLNETLGVGLYDEQEGALEGLKRVCYSVNIKHITHGLRAQQW